MSPSRSPSGPTYTQLSGGSSRATSGVSSSAQGNSYHPPPAAAPGLNFFLYFCPAVTQVHVVGFDGDRHRCLHEYLDEIVYVEI